jgi:ABC-2 type transport system ATP-binding protein
MPLLATHEEFSTAKSKNKKNIYAICPKETRKVGIIATLIGNPEVIILDEPFANLDPPHNLD